MNCLACGAQVRAVSFLHLRSCSGITPHQYREMFPGAALMDDDVRASFGRAMEANPNWRGGTTKRVCARCPRRLAPTTKGDLCTSCCKRGDGNPFAGRKHSDATRARMVESQGRRDPATRKYGTQSTEQLSASAKERWAAIPKHERASRISTFVMAGQRSRRSSLTTIEVAVGKRLSSAGIRYTANAKIGRCYVDIVIGGLVVECYGDYWHCHPSMFGPDDLNKSIKRTASEQWRRDADRLAYLRSLGYSTLAFWECEIRGDLDGVMSSILHALTPVGVVMASADEHDPYKD